MSPAHFTIAYWCVLIAALLPIVCAGIAKSGLMRTAPAKGGYDNNDPRAWLARQTDWRGRANAAQANTFEAVPFFLRRSSLPTSSRPASTGSTYWPCCLLRCASSTLRCTLATGPMRVPSSGLWHFSSTSASSFPAFADRFLSLHSRSVTNTPALVLTCTG